MKRNNKYHFIGLGTSGAMMLNGLKNKKVKGKYTSVGNHNVKLKKGIKKVFFKPKNKVYFYQPVLNYQYYKQFIKSIASSIDLQTVMELNDDRRVVVLVSLGGNTGTSSLMALMNYFNEMQKEVSVFATTPFDDEPEFSRCFAEIGVSTLKCDYQLINLEHLNLSFYGSWMKTQNCSHHVYLASIGIITSYIEKYINNENTKLFIDYYLAV